MPPPAPSRPFYAFWIVLVVAVSGLSAGMLAPSSDVPLGTPPQLAHFGAFTVLGMLVFSSTRALIVIAALSFLAIGFELAQNLVPTRTVDLVDALLNLGGIAFAWLAISVSRRRF